MLIPENWSRQRKQIAKAYFRHIRTLQPHESLVKIIGHEFGYTMDVNGNYPFVRLVINEVRKLDGAI